MKIEEVDWNNCDREPIHISGHIQPHGISIAVQEPELEILQIGENARDLLGVDAASSIGQDLSLFLNKVELEKLKTCLLNENLKAAGIGLAIGREIVVEKHGGKLSCISAPGKGTELIVEIPLSQTYEKLNAKTVDS